jgi:putative ABC transport system permease protein
VIALGGLARSSYDSLSNWMRIALNPDLFVTTAQNLTARNFVFPASLGDGLRQIPGVAEVQLVRSVRVAVKGGPVMLVALDVASVERRAKLPPVEGDQTDMYRRTERGEAVLASENFVRLHGGGLGETLEIPAPGGTLRLPIAGIVRDFSDQQGSLLISRDAYIRGWQDDSVNVFRLYLARGANSAEVR